MSGRPPERLWTLDEFAELWGRTRRTVERRIAEGKIRVVSLGPRTVRIPDSEVRRLTDPDYDGGDDPDREAPAGAPPAVSRMLQGRRVRISGAGSIER